MATRTITAMYDRYEEAAEAVRKLEAAGVAHSDISIVGNNEGDRASRYANQSSNSDRGDRADDAARLLIEYGLYALPVVGENREILGIIMVDDAMERLLPDSWRQRLKVFS